MTEISTRLASALTAAAPWQNGPAMYGIRSREGWKGIPVILCSGYSYDTTSQSELCNRAITELKKRSQIEVNYEIEISEFPENLKIGDRADIIDDGGGVYVSSRILKLETSIDIRIDARGLSD